MNVLDLLSQLSAIFLGILIEAIPFLLLGTLASGLVEVFIGRGELARLLPHNRFLAAAVGGLLGLCFPVCECGVVPLTRRLMQKGAPVGAGMAFLMAAPVINPVVIASTYSAFGNSPIFWGRLGGTLLIAVLSGWIFSRQADAGQVLRLPLQVEMDAEAFVTAARPDLRARLRQAAVSAADEFFEMGRYLVIGSFLAALMQTLVPQSLLAGIGRGPVLSVVALIAIAVLLSVCSTVDAFIALAFAGQFAGGAVLAFLVYGPMVDIKSTLMFAHTFKPRVVVYLVLLPLLLTLLMGILWNVWIG